jgi:hypothetical protein
MKTGIVLGGLVSVAWGCAARNEVSMSEIAANRIDAKGRVHRLAWLQRDWEPIWDPGRPSVVLAIHETEGSTWPAYSCSAYTVKGNSARLDAVAELGEGWWKPPTMFVDEAERFAMFETEEGGSSTYRTYVLLHLAESGARQIPITLPVETLSHLIRAGQHSSPERGGFRLDDGGRLEFGFSIWNPGETNNMPTGGHVHGLMKVERDGEGRPMRLVVGDWVHSKE